MKQRIFFAGISMILIGSMGSVFAFSPFYGTPPGFPAPAGQQQNWQQSYQQGIRIQQRSDLAGYQVGIRLMGTRPENINISRSPRGLIISTHNNNRMSQNSPGGHFQSQSWGMTSHTIALPPDANFQGMTRENAQNMILLHIPRYR